MEPKVFGVVSVDCAKARSKWMLLPSAAFASAAGKPWSTAGSSLVKLALRDQLPAMLQMTNHEHLFVETPQRNLSLGLSCALAHGPGSV